MGMDKSWTLMVRLLGKEFSLRMSLLKNKIENLSILWFLNFLK